MTERPAPEPEPPGAPKYEAIAAALQGQIDRGVWPPGDRIPSLRRLAAQHDVSVTTAVEAVRLLESRGVVASRPRSGYYVERPRREAPRAETPAAALRPRRVDVPLSLRMNLGIGSPQQPTLGAAVQGPELMPVAAVNRLMSQVLRLHPREAHSYDAPPGAPALRRAIAQRAADFGCRVAPDDIVITGGAKEAVYLSIRAVTRPGDTVAIESPAYYALLEVLASLDLRVVEVPNHGAGIDLDALARVLERGSIAAVALVSNHSNPSGSLMTDEAKQRLVTLLETHDVPLVEDDVYGDLAFDGHRPRAIKAFDRRGLVLYCGSCSKTVSPGLRIGWALPGRHLTELEHLKLVVNQASATAPQLALAAFLESGGFDRHLRRVRQRYRRQMEQAIEALHRHFPADTRHTEPPGGHVLWLQVPGLDALGLYDDAAERGIHVAPGPLFTAGSGYGDFVRLNTGFPWTDALEEQVRTLGRLVDARRS